ncbi:hypothetical protein PS15m_002097 [Mucor circinelloides]
MNHSKIQQGIILSANDVVAEFEDLIDSAQILSSKSFVSFCSPEMVKGELPFADLGDLFKSIHNKSYLLETTCCHFATSCFMLAKQSDNYNTMALDLLVAFALF